MVVDIEEVVKIASGDVEGNVRGRIDICVQYWELKHRGLSWRVLKYARVVDWLFAEWYVVVNIAHL